MRDQPREGASAAAACRVVFNVQPQTNGFYCVWAVPDDVEVTGVEYRSRPDAAWRLQRPAGTGRAFVPAAAQEDGGCELRLAVRAQDGEPGGSVTVHAHLRRRRWTDHLPIRRRLPYSDVRRFSDWPQFAAHANRRAHSRIRRPDGVEVDAADAALPNGWYLVGPERALLARAFGSRLETHPVNSPDAVCRTARRLLWGSERLPSVGAATALGALTPPIDEDLRSRYRATGFSIAGTMGTASRITHFRPMTSDAHGVAIYHEGHTGAAIDIGRPIIEELLARRFEVYAVDMPLCGLNAGDRSAALANHNELWRYENDASAHPIGLLVEPLLRLVGELAERRRSGMPLILLGRSGGGLMAYLYAALDDRIDGAVAVAGGVPLSQRLETSHRDLGDYEQFAPSFYDLVRHEDLMVAAGRSRVLLVFNRHDPDCFALGSDHPLHAYLAREAERFGARVETFVDPHHTAHSLGPAGQTALDRFLRTYERQPTAVELAP
jgi:hypothetical protein